MAFKNRIRLPITVGQPQFPIERNVFRKADGTRKTLSVVVSKTVQGVTDYLPEDWHQKLAIALSHDTVNIEDPRRLIGVSLDSDYSIEWSDFKGYPVAQGNFTAQVTPFSATNSNCQTCEEISQIATNDDIIEEDWNEGESHNIATVLSNDAICCFPAVVSLRSFNSLYFASVVLNPDGTATATLNANTPTGENVLVFTYRVTCPDGSYDEASVYVGSVTGTEPECEAPTAVTGDVFTSTSYAWTWTGSAAQYGWEIANAANPDVVVQSGVVYDEFVEVFDLLSETEYILTVWAICGVYNISSSEQGTGTTGAAQAHLDPMNYSYYASAPITGVCNLSSTNCVRTVDAAQDSTAANQKVKAEMLFSNDNGDPSVTAYYTFNIGSTTANETTAISFPNFCGAITAVCVDVQVIP